MQSKDRATYVAITGGICSGKSTVSKWFENKGFKIIYADKIGHKILSDSYVENQLRESFGNEIFDGEVVNRKKLGALVFDDCAKLTILNKITHENILKKIQLELISSEDDIIICEIPLLFELKLDKSFDLTINVSLSKEKQLQRLMKRNNLKEDDALKRIDSQMQNIEKDKKADIIIDNNLDIETLEIQLRILKPLLKLIKHKKVVDLI